MAKVSKIVLILILVVMLAGCGNKTNVEIPSEVDTTETYEEGDVIRTQIDEPDEKEPSESSEPSTADTAPSETSGEEPSTAPVETELNENEIRPEIKAYIDSYEDFMDEYIAFMKKYNSASDPSSLVPELATYTAKLADMMTKIEALKGADLTTAETAYYLKVTSRVLEKLSELE